MVRALFIVVFAFVLGFVLLYGAGRLSKPHNEPISSAPAPSSANDDQPIVRELGRIPPGAIVYSRIAIPNGRSRPAGVRVVNTSCGCLSPQLEAATIPPGGQTSLSLALDSGNRTGVVHAETIVELSWPESASVNRLVRLSAEIDPERGLAPRTLQLPTVWRGEDLRSEPISLRLGSGDEFIAEQLRWRDESTWMQVEAAVPGTAQANPFRAQVIVRSGLAPQTVCVYLNELFVRGHLNGVPVELKAAVRGEIRDPVYAEPKVLFWGMERRDEVRRVRIQAREGNALTILGVTPSVPDRISWEILDNESPNPVVAFRVLETQSTKSTRCQIEIRVSDRQKRECTPVIRAIVL